MLFRFVPDVRSVLPAGGIALRFGMVASVGFTVLQLYWFSKTLRVMLLSYKPKAAPSS